MTIINFCLSFKVKNICTQVYFCQEEAGNVERTTTGNDSLASSEANVLFEWFDKVEKNKKVQGLQEMIHLRLKTRYWL